MSDEEPKIIIDEDWKSQIEREREVADEAPAEGEETGEAEADSDEIGLFDHLISSLATQTMMSLGMLVEEGQDQVAVDLEYSRHLIDTLGLLILKTEGNLTPSEDRNLKEAVTELERVYIIRAQQVQEAQLRQDPENPKILP